ncbi:MAG: hypothetical protein ACXVNO_03075 [Bacteroidia bacterium]
MAYKVIIQQEAQEDTKEAYIYYEKQRAFIRERGIFYLIGKNVIAVIAKSFENQKHPDHLSGSIAENWKLVVPGFGIIMPI